MRENEKSKSGASSGPATTDQEDRRRLGQRHTVSAVVQVMDIRSGVRLNSRISDLGNGGCYIDCMTPLPLGSELRLRVVKDKKVIEVDATVIYSHPGLGMGVSFASASPEQRAEIDKWVADITKDDAEPATLENLSNQPSEGIVERKILLKLIHLLIAKGILAEDEARDILNKPIF